MSLSSLLEKLTQQYPELTHDTTERYFPVTQELARRFGGNSAPAFATAITELSSEFAKFHQLTQIKMDEATQLTVKKLNELATNGFELKNKIRRNSLTLQTIPAEILQQFPELDSMTAYFNPASIEKTLKELQSEIDHCQRRHYQQLADHAFKNLKALENDSSQNAQHERRRMTVLDYKHCLDKRNLLHIATILGDDSLVALLLDHATEMELDLDALDTEGNCAMQYCLIPLNPRILNLFLNSIASVSLLKNPTGNNLIESMKKINQYDDILALESEPLGKIVLHHYVHQFYHFDKLIEKMTWLNNIDINFKALLPLRDHADKTIRETSERFFDLHQHVTPIRTMLARAVGLDNSKDPAGKIITWCISVEEYQQTLELALQNEQDPETLQYVVCIDHMQDSLMALRKTVETTPGLRGIISMINYDLACIQGLVIYILQQKIVNHHYRFIEKRTLPLFAAIWQNNKKEAAEAMIPRAIDESIAAIKPLLENTLQPVKLKDNLEKMICVYLENLLYAENNKRTSEFLLKFEKGGSTLFSPETIKKWREVQAHLEAVITNTTVLERKNRLFGPMIAKYRIKHMLNDIQKTLSNEQAPVTHLFYQALTAENANHANQKLEEALTLFDEFDPIRKNWQNLTDIMLLAVTSFKKHVRENHFAEFNSLQASETGIAAMIN